MLSRDDGGRVESQEDVAEEFNEYFSSVFSVEDVGSIPEAVSDKISSYIKYVCIFCDQWVRYHVNQCEPGIC